jgi:hypothetical protein
MKIVFKKERERSQEHRKKQILRDNLKLAKMDSSQCRCRINGVEIKAGLHDVKPTK